jgi:hypothetical protein
MKHKIKILDGSFSHSELGYCSDFQSSDLFEWDRNVTGNEEKLVVTDNFLTTNLPQSKGKVAWLIEPVCVAPHHYDYVKNNLMRFDHVLTHEKTLLDLGHNISFVPFGCCWIAKNDQQIYKKNKNISTISSSKTFTDGHKLRHEVIEKFSDKIDVYGRGYSPVEFKIEGLKDYRFSVVIENCKRDYWFTEKLIDCFMTGTIPIYWGCPSIGEFFNTEGMLIFNNLDELEDILNKCDEKLYDSKIKSVYENFEISKKFTLPDNYVYEFIKKNYNA